MKRRGQLENFECTSEVNFFDCPRAHAITCLSHKGKNFRGLR